MNEDTRVSTPDGTRHAEPRAAHDESDPARRPSAVRDEPAPGPYHYTVEWDTNDWGAPGATE